jgi:hypothetical protein
LPALPSATPRPLVGAIAADQLLHLRRRLRSFVQMALHLELFRIRRVPQQRIASKPQINAQRPLLCPFR